MPIDPASVMFDRSEWAITNGSTGAEWTLGRVAEGGQAATEGASFGDILATQVGRLQGIQSEAAQAAQQLATGEATDPTAAIVAVDRARLAMQMASALRQKGVESVQEILRTQI